MKLIGTTFVLESEFEKLGFDPNSLPRRRVLLEAISKYEFDSLLDVGAGMGQDLFLLKEIYPNANLVGIDKNADTRVIQKDNLRDFKDNEFDLVISDCAVNYAPELLSDMIRVAKKAVVMVEPGIKELTDVLPKNTKITNVNGLGMWGAGAYIYEIVK